MKKVSALLLTAVLGSSMVFAGISGTVTTSYGMNLDNQKLGFTNGNDVEADFSFTTEGEAISEGDIHAEISADLTILLDGLNGDSEGTYYAAMDKDGNPILDDGDQVYTQVPLGFTVDDSNLSAKIVGPNWYVDIAGPDDLVDFAEDIDADDDGEAFHNWGFTELGLKGIAVGYTYEEGKTVVVSIGSDIDVDDATASNYVAVASPEYMLAEGLTAEFAAAFQNVNDDFDFGGGMTMTLADEEMDYSLTAAADMGYVKDEFDFEVSADGTYSLATIEAYFATTVVDNSDADDSEGEDYSFDAISTGTNLISAIVTLDLAEVTAVPVSVYAQVMGVKDSPLGVKAQYRMNAGVDYTIAMDEASLAVGLFGGMMYDDANAWMAGADAEYTAANDAYVVDAEVRYLNKTKEVTPTVSIETTTLVNGATLTVDYDAARFALDDTLASGKAGAVTLTCEIEL